MRVRGTEEGDEAVAAERVDVAVEVLHDPGNRGEDAVRQVADLLRVEPPRHGAEGDEIDEQHAHLAALPARQLTGERAAAHAAEAVALWVVVAAGSAGHLTHSPAEHRSRVYVRVRALSRRAPHVEVQRVVVDQRAATKVAE